MNDFEFFQKLIQGENFQSLDQLTTIGKRFFTICVHLLLKKDEKNNMVNTFEFLQSKKTISVSRTNIMSILQEFRRNGSIYPKKSAKKMPKNESQNEDLTSPCVKKLTDLDIINARNCCNKHTFGEKAKFFNISKSGL